jgi:putative tryptophan/tyrosine transport system substrate-binding protein
MRAARAVVAMALIFGVSAAAAQSKPRIGIFTFGVPYSGPLIGAFREGLRAEGYVEGRNIAFVFRSVEGQPERAAALAAELVGLEVDVIVTEGFPTALAAKRATATIPIVMAAVGDPVKLGLVTSFRQPGGNVTGLTLVGAERTQKQLQLLKEIAPSAATVAVLYNVSNPSTPGALADARAAASLLGLSLRLVPVRGPDDLEAAFAQITNSRPDAFITLGDGMLLGSHRRIAEFGVRSRLPGVFPEREFADAGAVASYGPNVEANFRRAAAFVGSILKGARPGDLPIEQPTKYDVVINMKTAKGMGLTIPPAVLVRAEHIVQ